MKKIMRISWLARLLLLAACGAAPALHAANFLWEVSSPGNRAYLFGTVHAGKAGWYPLPTAVEEALADSRVLVVEADITDTAAMSKYGASTSYTPPDSLRNHVSVETYGRFLKLLPRYRFPEAQMAQMKPFIAVSLLVFAEWARLGYSPQYGLENYLIKQAKAENKPIRELEGIESQMRLMDSLTDKENQVLFEGTLSALEDGLTGEQIEGLVKAWQVGDPQGMLEMARKYNSIVPGAAAFEEKFVWSRHDDMLNKIEGYLRDSKERHFIAVGSLHLVGPRGLVEQLRKRGYVVRQRFVTPIAENRK
jgi:uncharacterized protein YbaP (TraB family)